MGVFEIALTIGYGLLKAVVAGVNASKEERDALYVQCEDLLREGLDKCIAARAEHNKDVAETQAVIDAKRKALDEQK